jgi:Tol biopolymer transport system component
MKRIVLLALVLAAAVGATTSYATAPGKAGRIAFRRYFDNDHNWGAVFTINANGTGERQITHPPKGVTDDQPDWAPDGSLIAFSRCPKKPEGPCAVYTVHPDGSALTRVSKPCPPSGKIPPCTDDYLASFSPDGRELVFKQFSGNQKNGRGQNIVIADLGTGEQRVAVYGTKSYTQLDPQFSPDGKQLLFTHVVEPSERNRALFVANVDGTGVRRVTPWSLHAGDNPDWSPDGRWILFRSNEDLDAVQSQIYLIHPNGTGMKQLTHFKKGSIVTSSSFSPDGKWIVFGTDGVGGNADLFVMRPDGSGMHPITRTKLWDSAPDWGPTP